MSINPEQNFSNLLFRARSLLLFKEAIEKYHSYLKKYESPGNEKIRINVELTKRLVSYIDDLLKDYHGEWDINYVSFTGKSLIWFKSSLVYLLRDTKSERQQLVDDGAPSDATERFDRKIEQIEELMNTGLLAQIEPVLIMGPIPNEQIVQSFAQVKSRDYPLMLDEELQETVREIKEEAKTNDRAINDALVILEDRIRSASGLKQSDFGDRLVDKAFRPEGGRLIFSDETNEQEGYWLLYKGILKKL